MRFNKLKKMCTEIPIDAHINSKELFNDKVLYVVPSETKPVKIVINDDWSIREKDGFVEFTRQTSTGEFIHMLINEIEVLRDEIDRLER